MPPTSLRYAKHLTKRFLSSRYPNHPIIIVRQSCIGSAVSRPFPLYGPMSATPIEQCFKLLTLNPSTGIIHVPESQTSGTNLFDEIPIDWASNLILLHAAAGTRGVVHAGAESFTPRSFDHKRRTFLDGEAMKKIIMVQDKSIPQCSRANFYKPITRDWWISNQASEKFGEVSGRWVFLWMDSIWRRMIEGGGRKCRLRLLHQGKKRDCDGC